MVWQRIQRMFRRSTPPAASIKPSASVPMNQHTGCRSSAPLLPAPPRDILASRFKYEDIIYHRTAPPAGTDTPLAALYRIYEHILLDQNIEMRNELEYFWYQNSWKINEIPDPNDPDPERYAVLACIPALLVLAFNERICLGLPRDAPSIVTHDMLEDFRNRPKRFGEEPPWTSRVSRLESRLDIPHWDRDKHDFVPLEGFSSEKASKEFQKKNILIWQPHIYFT